MKKILAGILALCLTLNLAACSSAPASSGGTDANATYPDGMVSAGSLFKGAIWLDKQASAEVKEKAHCSDSFATELSPYDSPYTSTTIGCAENGLSIDSNWKLTINETSDNVTLLGFDTGDFPVYACISYKGEYDSCYTDVTMENKFIPFLQKEKHLAEGTVKGTVGINDDGSFSSAISISAPFDFSRHFYAINSDGGRVGLNCLPLVIENSLGKECGYFEYSSKIISHSCLVRIFSLVPVNSTASERETAIRRVLTASANTRSNFGLDAFYRLGTTGYAITIQGREKTTADLSVHPSLDEDKNAHGAVLGDPNDFYGGTNLYLENQTYKDELELGNKDKYTEFLKSCVSTVPSDANYEQSYSDVSISGISTLADNQELVKFKITYPDGYRFVGGLVNLTDVKQAFTIGYLVSPNSNVKDSSLYAAISTYLKTLRFDEDLKLEVK